jgi:dihydroorotase-like cyclic amidohydrolase
MIPPRTHNFPRKFRRIILPGLIDPHVNVRGSADNMEDWLSCTKAALLGGYTMICVVPTDRDQVRDSNKWNKLKLAAESASHCDYAIIVGSSTDVAKCQDLYPAAIFLDQHPVSALNVILNNFKIGRRVLSEHWD